MYPKEMNEIGKFFGLSLVVFSVSLMKLLCNFRPDMCTLDEICPSERICMMKAVIRIMVKITKKRTKLYLDVRKEL